MCHRIYSLHGLDQTSPLTFLRRVAHGSHTHRLLNFVKQKYLYFLRSAHKKYKYPCVGAIYANAGPNSTDLLCFILYTVFPYCQLLFLKEQSSLISNQTGLFLSCGINFTDHRGAILILRIASLILKFCSHFHLSQANYIASLACCQEQSVPNRLSLNGTLCGGGDMKEHSTRLYDNTKFFFCQVSSCANYAKNCHALFDVFWFEVCVTFDCNGT